MVTLARVTSKTIKGSLGRTSARGKYFRSAEGTVNAVCSRAKEKGARSGVVEGEGEGAESAGLTGATREVVATIAGGVLETFARAAATLTRGDSRRLKRHAEQLPKGSPLERGKQRWGGSNDNLPRCDFVPIRA